MLCLSIISLFSNFIANKYCKHLVCKIIMKHPVVKFQAICILLFQRLCYQFAYFITNVLHTNVIRRRKTSYFTIIILPQMLLLPDMKKPANRANLVCGHLCEKLWTFCQNSNKFATNHTFINHIEG